MSLTIVNKRCPEETNSDYAYRLIRRNIMNLYLKPGAVLNEAELSDQLGMSRTPLYAKLKALTNMGVNDYINMIRIEKASQLLTGSTMNITEISETVGFDSPRPFSTLFKQLKGITPSQFRQQEKKG